MQISFKKSTRNVSLFIIVLLSQLSFSQNENKEGYLNENVKSLLNLNPEQALSITKLMLSKSNITSGEKARINVLNAKAYKVKGDYSSALNLLFDSKNYKNQTSEFEKLVIDIDKISILDELSFSNEAEKKLADFEKKQLNSSDKKLLLYKNASIALEKAKILLNKQNYSEGISILKKEYKNVISNFPDLDIWYKITFGQLHNENRNFIEAIKFYNEALQIINSSEIQNKYAKIYILSGLSKIDFYKKDYTNAIQTLKEANSFSIDLKNLFLQEMITQQLNVNYLAINDVQNYKQTNVELIKIRSEIEGIELEAVNTVYNLISEEQIDFYKKEEAGFDKIIYIFLTIFLLILGVFAIIWWQLIQKKKRLKEIINYLNVTRNNFINLIPVIIDEPKKISIPKETEEMLLKKLEKFEKTIKFTNKDISLAVLAGQFDTNTKYLSEVINSNFNINFNSYINKLRINYIVEKLKTDSNYINYKISYLAENSGFSSHSSFTTVFKSVTGVSPVVFIDLVRNENLKTKSD